MRPRRSRGQDVNGPETAHAGIAGSVLIDGAPAAIVATAPDGTLTAWNRRAEQLFGYTAEEAIGCTPEELGAGPAEAALGSRARGGDVWEGELAVVRKDGSHIRVHVVSAPVTDADGNPPAASASRSRPVRGDRAQPAQMRWSCCSRRASSWPASLDADAGLQGVARLAASWLADVCAFDLLDDEAGMRRVAVADADRARAPLTERLRAFPPDPDALHMTAALREGRTEILHDLSDEVLRDRLHGPRHIEVVRQIDARSAVILPLAARGRTLGAMLLLSCGDRPPFSADDVAVAEELARRTAVAVDNSVLLRAAQERADAAQRLQRLSDAALSHVDLDDLLDEILALLRKELGSDAAAVLLMEGDADHLAVRATSGTGTEAGVGAARRRRRRLGRGTGDRRAARSSSTTRPRPRWDRSCSAAACARCWRRRCGSGRARVGVLQTDWLAPRPLGQDEIDLIGLAAGRIALAVDRAQAYEAEHDARLRLELLARTSDVLGESLDFRAALGSLTHLLVPHLADWCAVDLVEPDRSHRTWVAHSDPAKVELARELVRRYPADPEAAAGASGLRTDDDAATAPAPPAFREGGADEEHRAILRGLDVRSVIVAPLTARGRTHGTLTLVDGRVGPHVRAGRRGVHNRARPPGGDRDRHRPPVPGPRPGRAHAPAQPAPARPARRSRHRARRRLSPGRRGRRRRRRLLRRVRDGRGRAVPRHRRRLRQGRAGRRADRHRPPHRAGRRRARALAEGDPADAEPGAPAPDDRAPLLHGRRRPARGARRRGAADGVLRRPSAAAARPQRRQRRGSRHAGDAARHLRARAAVRSHG